MRFEAPLLPGVLISRYKRFLADVRLADGHVVTAHCPNSGSMLSVSTPGSEVWLSRSDKPSRRLPYTWELIRVGEALVGINTGRPGRIVEEALAHDRVPELAGYSSLRREVRYGRNSRIDLLLEAPGRPKCFVEIKNVTLKRDPGRDVPVAFPDAVTVRGTKHLVELGNMVQQGERAVMLYVVQRPDAERFAFADDIDRVYARSAAFALATGVEMLCYRCSVGIDAVRLTDAIPITAPALATG